MTPNDPISNLDSLTVCCGLTLREPIERWIGPLRREWPGKPPQVRLLTIPMLEHEPPMNNSNSPEQGSALIAVLPESEPSSQAQLILEYARNTGQPTLVLCERVDDRKRAMADEGILVEPWDIEPASIISIMSTLARRQPTVNRLTRELDIAEQLLAGSPVPGSAAEQLTLAGLIPDEMIPKNPPRIFGLDIGISHRSSGAIPRDLIDVTHIDEDTIRIFAADGLSEGTAGALIAMRLVKAIRSLGSQNHMHKIFHPGAALAELNQEICEIGSHGVPYRATALYAIIETRLGEITVASAGYPLPRIVRDRAVRCFGQIGSPLGARDSCDYQETVTPFSQNDLLTISSDGSEQAFREAAGYNLSDELARIAGRSWDLKKESLRIEELYDSLPGSLHRTNDCTMLMMRLTEALKFDRGAA